MRNPEITATKQRLRQLNKITNKTADKRAEAEKERDGLRADNERLREALQKCVTAMHMHNYTIRENPDLNCGHDFGEGFGGTVDQARQALASTQGST